MSSEHKVVIKTLKLLLLIFIFSVSSGLHAASWKYYNLYRKLSQPIAVNIDRLEDPVYVSHILKRLTNEISRDPYNKLLRFIRFQYSLVMWDILPFESKGDFAKIAIGWADDDLKFFPEEPIGWGMKSIFMGAYSLSIGTLNALQFALQGKQLMEKAYLLSNPHTITRAFASGILGRMYFKLPPFPVSFGDVNKSEVYLKEAVAIDPNNIYFNIFLAELLSYTGRIDEALHIIDGLPSLKVTRWYHLISKKWTLRTLKTIRAAIESGMKGVYSKYNYDFLLDPERHHSVDQKNIDFGIFKIK